MTGTFSILDWLIVAGYLLLLFGMGWAFTFKKSQNAQDYFLGGNKMPYWVVAISVIATTQSAATFLGGPDQGYRGNYTYLAVNIGAILASLFVAKILIPKFYALNVTTVYELLENRYSKKAMRAAGAMYIIGRFFAGGSRLYLAAIAVSMILYSNIDAQNIISAAFILILLGFSVTFLSGIRSILWSDFIQFIIYTFSAIAVLYFLLDAIPLNITEIFAALKQTPTGQNKLQLLNFDLNFTDPYAFISILTGITLLYIANFGLDQDTTQRLLTCSDDKQGAKALIISAIIAVPLIWLFISIGQLLHIFYDRPELMNGGAHNIAAQEFQGEKITIFMYYILNELPSGLKGLVTVGVIAAAVSTINSGLNSMSSVIVQDFYRPWREKHSPKDEKHYVRAGQLSMGVVGLGLFAMAIICFYWQKYSGLPLLDFALSVMVFAYSGLLGVYFTVLFTNRGSTNSVIFALIAGFLATLAQQEYIIDLFQLPNNWKGIAFTWQLCIGTGIASMVCLITSNNKNINS
ncbi:MAG: sodium:solute symporter [Kordiimonadaceae bacterium]|jgi:solute:Na+ symporter, SSS family|nr:sodium:solute symporter [Kordiimonadaceae bacterium]MBT6033743.1 sodium:solute symporter [Kordiimonadaceae bacterium]